MGKPRRTSCKTNGFPGELLSSGMRPARGRGSRGGADVLTLPWGSVVPRHSAMHDRCIRAAPCLSKRNKLSEPRWAFERHDGTLTPKLAWSSGTFPRGPQISTPWKSSGGGLRKRLRAMDLADLKAKRRPVQRTALKARVRSIVASGSAKLVAKNYAFGLRKVCEEVRRKKGAATRG